MTGLRQSIRDSDEYQATTNQSQTAPSQGETLADALGPMLDLDTRDAAFWAQVGQLVLLYLILRELRRGR